MKDASDNIRDVLTYKIIGCAMKVHNTLGGRFPEVIYQRCLALEMKSANLKFDREKAVFSLEDIHFVHAKNYVVAYNFPKGLLINFAGRSPSKSFSLIRIIRICRITEITDRTMVRTKVVIHSMKIRIIRIHKTAIMKTDFHRMTHD